MDSGTGCKEVSSLEEYVRTYLNILIVCLDKFIACVLKNVFICHDGFIVDNWCILWCIEYTWELNVTHYFIAYGIFYITCVCTSANDKI